MMTIHKLSAGDGYRYYTRETATADVRREGARELGDYYTAEGNPPGQWVGSGAAQLGVSGTVTESQMKALFGEGLHPDAERIIAERLAAGDDAQQAVRAARLGRRYYQYETKDGEFGRRLAAEMADLERREHRPVSPEEQTALRGRVGAQMFREHHGRNPGNRTELGQFITAQGGKGSTAVAGFDAVFAAPKSVSVLWGLGTAATRTTIEQAHEQAIADTLRWIEQNALMTRTGVNGIAQEDVVGGLVATRFRHYDSRAGDPMLHDHVVIANKVKGADGKWRSIDGTLLLQMNVPASEYYNQRVVEEVSERLGMAAQAREVTPGKRPVMEIAGVDTELIEAHSRRSTDIHAELDKLLRVYVAEHGYEPSPKARLRLMQQATLATRPDKPHARSLAELVAQWRADTVALFGAERVDQLEQRALNAARPLRARPVALDVDALAAAVVETVSDHRATWRRSHLEAEARRQVTAATLGVQRVPGLVEHVTDRAVTQGSIDITPPDPNPSFGPLTRADGASVYQRKGSELYTSAAVLAAEDRVVAAAKTPAIPAVSDAVFETVLAAHAGPLDPGQQRLARAFATGERLLVAGVGPAGAGKTSALRLVADAVRAEGGRVIGLGPSARAAQVMTGEIRADAFTLHEWLAQRQRAADGRPIEERYQLRPGDVVIVDEAGMAGTRRLATVVEEARRAGAHVRLIGDPAQLAAVESGGVLRLLAQQGLTVELETVHRFQTPGEGAASLQLRDGDAETAFAWYRQHGRIVGGSYEQMVGATFERWQLDTDAGHVAMMMAEDNVTVADLNRRAQAWRMSSGQLDASQAAPLRDEQRAYAGDLLLTRQNRRKLKLRGGKDFVKNGDVWSVESVHHDGSVTVQHTDHGGRIRLDAAYLRDHAQLGYAATGHRGQGATVDTGGGLASARTSRESAYVMLTRGRGDNRLYLVLENGESVDDALTRIARNTQASRSAHETIRAEQDRAWGIGQLAAEYTDVHARALGLRYQGMARDVLGDQVAEMFIAAEAWPAVERALREAEQAGFQPETILAAAFAERDFADADESAAVLSWRIDRRVDEGLEAAEHTGQAPGSRPLADYSPARLDELAAQARTLRTQAHEDLQRAEARVAGHPRPVTAWGLPHPAWPDRRHGGLTRTELAEHLATARRDARRPGDREQAGEAARRAAELRAEQRLRRALPPLDRAREDWQRENSTASFGRPERTADLHGVEHAQQRLQRAEVIAAQITAEQRRRSRLPDGQPPHVDHTGELPTWLAPDLALADQTHTPPDWREHLDQRRDVLRHRLQHAGQTLAADPPTWARPLGPVPSADHPLHDRWQHTAALADAWRVRNQTPATRPGLGAEPAEPRQAEAWRALQAEVDDVGRRARAVEAAAQRRTGLDAQEAERRRLLDQLNQPGPDDAPTPEHAEARQAVIPATGWRGAAVAAEPSDADAPQPAWRRAQQPEPGQDLGERDRQRRRRDAEEREDRDQAPER